MHLCGNALTAAQERESAHVPFSMLGTSTKTTITWGWLFITGNRTNKLISWNSVEIWNNSFSYATCLIDRSSKLCSIALLIQVGDLVNIWVLPASRWAIRFDHTILLLFCDRQVFVVVTFLHLPELWPLGSFLFCPRITSLKFLSCSSCAVPPFELHSGGAVVLIIASAIFGHFCLFSLLL